MLAVLTMAALAGEQLIGFEYAIYNEPAPEKKDKGGEDAWYANDYLLSVADGVGGWNTHGIDPSKYSRKLETNVKNFFSRNEKFYRENPKELMQIAADNDKETGSSTFIIVTIDPTKPILQTSLLGDSGYYILRKNEEGKYTGLFRSQEQQHRFNFPFQCGTNGDPISSALTNSHEIQENDMVIVGTDGLFDNVFDEEIVKIVNENEGLLLTDLVKKLGEFAFKQSLRGDFMSPFAKNAVKEGYRFTGGKSDDITIVIGVIKRAIEA